MCSAHTHLAGQVPEQDLAVGAMLDQDLAVGVMLDLPAHTAEATAQHL